jgi:aminoglycoside 6'-N-acetyltransferase I
MFEVRRAMHTDSAGWLRMREALWPEEHNGYHAAEIEQFFAGKLDMPLEVLVAVDGFGALIGFAELSIRRYAEGCVTDRVAYLEGWFVEEQHRRHGVGAALVAAAEAWARKQGCTEFGSDALLENEISAAAHKALGFEEVERIRCFKKPLT